MEGGRGENCIVVKMGRSASDEAYVYNMCLPAVMIGFTSVRGF